ncbi:hypothetical protein [Phaeobacter porticola]|uniref:Integral membrane protein n=1 Tax=Phaeobacter porticola TaxID=1844006 RepID=A0A1L3IA75_9RHOB|nr:hypothetical protein [Phaeobacter porticola]APG48962.1 hypothetical protein PhaeoP97_03610 [Phaeobacter porticola]
MRRIIVAMLALGLAVQTGYAQTTQRQDNQFDCDDDSNAEEEDCLLLIEPVAGQFAPMIAPAIGLFGLALIAGIGSSGSTSTTSTD